MPKGNYTRKPRGPYQPIKERFEKYIYMEPMSGCWLWLGGINGNGYGSFWNGNNPHQQQAHCASWEIYKGHIPEGLYVCHHCDIRSCVNPIHLFLGTQKDNMQDSSKKGRIDHGEKRPQAKLTENQVIQIRNDNREHRFIAIDYGVAKSTIGLIKREKRWKYLKQTPSR